MAQEREPTARELDGSCHCGNVKFTLAWPDGERTIAVRACGCSFCRKHRGVWTSHPRAGLRVRVGDPAKVERYRFGTSTADFHICRICGVVPVVTSTIDDVCYGIVNVNCLDDPQSAELSETPTDFDGETTESRLGRRSRNWIPYVEIESRS